VKYAGSADHPEHAPAQHFTSGAPAGILTLGIACGMAAGNTEAADCSLRS
jgi:O-acetylhomoserine (thiol)-lyase